MNYVLPLIAVLSTFGPAVKDTCDRLLIANRNAMTQVREAAEVVEREIAVTLPDVKYYRCVNQVVTSDETHSAALVSVSGRVRLTNQGSFVHDGPMQLALLAHDAVERFSSPQLGRVDQPMNIQPGEIQSRFDARAQTLVLQAKFAEYSKLELTFGPRVKSLTLDVFEDDEARSLFIDSQPTKCLFAPKPI